MIIFYVIACVLLLFLFIILYFRQDLKKVDAAWLIINDFDKKITDSFSRKDLMMIKAEIYKNYIKDGMITCRLPLEIKRILNRIDDKLEILKQLNK